MGDDRIPSRNAFDTVLAHRAPPGGYHEPEMVIVQPGVAWLKQYLPLDEQQALVARCRNLIDGPAGGYVPTVRGGGRMRVRMVCLGRHW